MNKLPADRRILNARTHSQSWSASHYAPIRGPYKAHGITIRGALLVLCIGVSLAFILAIWASQ